MAQCVIGIDPGRAKCGVALLTVHGEVLYRAITPLSELEATVRELAATHRIVRIAVGNRTGSQVVAERLQDAGLVDACGGVTFVDEHMSTVEGRSLYWRSRPPRGWRRLVPEGMRTPPEPYDGWVAEVLARRYLEARKIDPTS